MSALTVYRRLSDSGVTVSKDGGKLVASPAARLTDELRASIRDHKPELLELLTDASKTTADLLKAAMRACDYHGDGKAGRDQMRAECLATPPTLQADLLTHFKQTYPESKT